ncbi:hypothetical protein TYRP_020680 [Tyrophagus putrescentiae]|nr:hypothetical protein TYRP_020680 [Tyrophagus putrescentiae]
MSYTHRLQLTQREMHVNLHEAPQELMIALGRQAMAASLALGRLVISCQHILDFALVSRLTELNSSMRRHLIAQAEGFMGYYQQGVMPTYYWGDFQHRSMFFVVNRAAVCQEDNVNNNEVMHRFHSPNVIAARHQIIALVRDLIVSLQNSSVQYPILAAILPSKEEAMMAAATSYMRALQKMSIETHRIIASIANNH